MNQDSRNGSTQERGIGRLLAHLWKLMNLAVIAAIIVIGVSGCALDDLSSTFSGDVPFEQEQTQSPEMGAVDNAPTVADDAAFDDIGLRPLPPMN